MSVHSQQAAQPAAHPEFPRHVVTAVLVSHDGERWLPEVLSGLLGQERPVQDVIAADTGSADASATLITEAFGAERVLHLARRTGFGSAVAEAARTAPVLTPEELPYLKRPAAWDPVNRTWDTSTYDLPEHPHGEPVHWLWLLHDDSAPEPDALDRLLRQADASPSAAIVGAKLRGWYDRRQLLEVGVSLAYSGRRWTGLDRREQDQGQHDRVRPVLSVSTAGMLIRRDVFEQLGGFDRRLPLTRDDVDLCWRAQQAGHGVLIAPDAVLRHAEAATRERRSIDCAGRLGGSPHRVDKAAAAYALLANSRAQVLPWVLFRLVLGTLLRVLAYLVGKQPGRALDEAAGLLATLLRPGRLIGARRARARAAAADHDPKELRPLFPPPGATIRTTVEQVASNFGGRSEPASASGGRHGAVESGPSDDDADSLQVEQFARVKRLAKRPGPMLFLVLLVVSLLAARNLIGGGALAGGALLPAPAEAGALWDRYLATWQPVGTGGTESAPPYLGLLALLSSALLGNPGPAMTLLLVASVPLAGLSAYFASRPLVMSRLLRAWGSVAYAFLPAITGALAGGRIGTAVLAVLLPALVRSAVAAAGHTRDGIGPWRAVWACALLLTVGAAFTPVIWPMALVLACCALLLPWQTPSPVRRAKALRFGIALATPLLVLAPWSLTTLLSPSAFLREAGLPYETGSTSALQLMGLSPGGPGTPSGWLLAGVLLAALGALLRTERRLAIHTAWAAALTALLFAVWSDVDGWAGPASLLYGLALLCAAVLGADGARYRVAARSFGWRQPLAVAVAGAAAAGPLLVAAGWVLGGADGPLKRTDPVQVPAFVAAESTTRDQARTLVLDARGVDVEDGEVREVSYTLVRGSGARLGDADLAELLGEDTSLSKAVGDLTAGTGADQTRVLADYAVRYVLVRDGSPEALHRVLDTTPGLQRLSQEDGSALWRVNRESARAMVLPAEDEGPGAEPVPLPAESVEIHTELPEGPAGRVLRLADSADEGWTATLDGASLTPVTVGGWAQGFELPAGGGRLDVVHETSGVHTLWVWAQGLGLLVLCVLSLPDRRRELDDDMPEPEAEAAPVGRRARRMASVPAQGGPAAEPEPAEAPQPEPRQPEWAPTAAYQDGGGYDGGAQPYQDGSGYPSDQYGGQPTPGYPPGQPVPEQQPYGDWAGQPYQQGYDQGQQQSYDQSYVAPYDYPTDYGDGSDHR
ncbi:glycosyltransferase family 2 protein [Streptomyces sp. NBRC 109706]|uniref:glycosyltransferase family 2 protein n=1 Tax=Streptomyces sp. NBRC 109706 TaxID=1550035 RepID=UPI000782E74E|nr:glycosyltransferase family 2 protein [Streptomyces sp. NBRC 109706]